MTLEPADEYEHEGFTVRIVPDDMAQEPGRDFDVFGKIAYPDSPDGPATVRFPRYWEDYWGTVGEVIRELRGQGCSVIPVRYSDYGSSGARIHETGPADANGYIYADRATIVTEYGDASPRSRRRARSVLRSELDTWDQIAQGEIYGYVIDNAEGELVDSCWGFIGDPDRDESNGNYVERGGYIHEAARDAADWAAQAASVEADERAHWAARDVVTI